VITAQRKPVLLSDVLGSHSILICSILIFICCYFLSLVQWSVAQQNSTHRDCLNVKGNKLSLKVSWLMQNLEGNHLCLINTPIN
jgi:uncharacterized membrane protein